MRGKVREERLLEGLAHHQPALPFSNLPHRWTSTLTTYITRYTCSKESQHAAVEIDLPSDHEPDLCVSVLTSSRDLISTGI